VHFANRNSLPSSGGGATLACGCALFFLLTWLVELGQPSFAHQGGPRKDEKQPDLKAFVGTWNGTFKGDLFATLVLKQERGSLAGTLNNFDINVDRDGNLTEGTHKDDGDAPLLNIHFKSGALYFTVLEKDQYRDGMIWKFVPLNAREGELTPVLDHQEDLPANLIVKSIHMLRRPP